MDFDPRSIDDSRDRDHYGRELSQGSRGGLSNPRERAAQLLAEVLQPRLAAHPRQRLVYSDLRQPGREFRPAVKLRKMRVRVDVRFLHHVFGLALVPVGADNGYGHPHAATLGALEAASERGIWGIGVDVDQSHLGRHILTSAVKRMPVRLGRSPAPDETVTIRAGAPGTAPREQNQ